MPSLAELASGTSPSGSSERPRLKLAPRSAAASAAASAPAAGGGKNPFGAARPREDTLRAKGVDVAEIDKKIDIKASSNRLTRQQQEEADAVAAELAHVEKELREANENEMPENELRGRAEAKREELDELLSKFAQVNIEKQSEKAAQQGNNTPNEAAAEVPNNANKQPQPRPTYERPSERRKRLEARAALQQGGQQPQQGGQQGGYNNNNNNNNGGGGYQNNNRHGGGYSR